MQASKDIAGLIAIIEALRDPQTDFPWEIAQNFEIIKPYTIERGDHARRGQTRCGIQKEDVDG